MAFWIFKYNPNKYRLADRLITPFRKFMGSVESARLSLRHGLPAEPEGEFQPVREEF